MWLPQFCTDANLGSKKKVAMEQIADVGRLTNSRYILCLCLSVSGDKHRKLITLTLQHVESASGWLKMELDRDVIYMHSSALNL